MSTSEVVSNSLTNGILFILVILFVHFAVKTALERRRGSKERFGSSLSSHAAPVPISDANNAALLDYVFGGVSNVASNETASDFKKFIESPIQKTYVEPPAPPPLPTDTGLGSEGLSEGGYYVYNKFQNESVLCGGSIYPDAPDLQGFDGKSVPFSW